MIRDRSPDIDEVASRLVRMLDSVGESLCRCEHGLERLRLRRASVLKPDAEPFTEERGDLNSALEPEAEGRGGSAPQVVCHNVATTELIRTQTGASFDADPSRTRESVARCSNAVG